MSQVEALKAQGQKAILLEDSFYDAPINVNANVAEFLEIFDEAIKSSEQDFITGFSLNIGHYITENFGQFDKSTVEALWPRLITLMSTVTNYSSVFGVIDAVETLIIRTKSVDPSIMTYLTDPNSANSNIKPYALVSLYEDLPANFLAENADYFAPLIVNAFPLKSVDFRISLILLLYSMKISADAILSIPHLFSTMWDFILFVATSSVSDFSSLVGPLDKLKSQIPELFQQPVEAIGSIIASISQTTDILATISPLWRLASFLPSQYLDTLLDITPKALADFMETKREAPKAFFEAVNDSFESDYTEEQTSTINETLWSKIQSSESPGVILLLSLFSETIERLHPNATSFLVPNIVSNIKSIPKIPLFYSISFLTKAFESQSRIAFGILLPHLIESLFSEDQNAATSAAKAISRLLKQKCVPTSHISPDIFSKLISNVQYFRPAVFKVLTRLADFGMPDELSKLAQFAHSILYDEESDIDLKGRALYLYCDLNCRNSFEVSEILSKGLSTAMEILEKGDKSSLISAGRFCSAASNAMEIADMLVPLFEKMIDVIKSRMTLIPDEVRLLSFFLSSISANLSKDTRFAFPPEIIKSFLESKDPMFKARAVNILSRIPASLPKEFVLGCLQSVFEFCKQSQNIIVVNNCFTLSIFLIKQGCLSNAEDFLQSTLSGRIALLDHMKPFDYSYGKFKLYKFLAKYFKKYTKRAHSIFLSVESWIPRVDRSILDKVIYPIIVGVQNNILENNSEVTALWETLYDRLLEESSDAESSSPLIACLVELWSDYQNFLVVTPLLSLLKDMWENCEGDEEFVDLLPPVFLEIYANDPQEPAVDEEIFDSAAKMVCNQECEWDYDEVVGNIITIAKKNQFAKFVQLDSALVLANFALQSEEELSQLGFKEDKAQEIRSALQEIAGGDEACMDHILQVYSKKPKKLAQLKRILQV